MINLYAALETPDYVQMAMNAPAMERLRHVDMNCGMNYTSFPRFVSMNPYSRFEHSVGVGKLVCHFTHDPVMSLAGLFHDISTPVFSHVVDFMEGDHMTQESTEALTAQMIQEDPVLSSLLESMDIALADVSDYHRYPIADNDSPRLSCDRLEYTFGNMVNYGFRNASMVQEILNDLVITKNEEGVPELSFQSEALALDFAEAALACGCIYSGNENRYAMERLARLLKKAVSKGVLFGDDLYTKEELVIERLKNSELSEEWDAFTRLYAIETGTEADGLRLDAKRRYIDPLIVNKGRVSDCVPSFAKAVNEFKEESYDLWLKGITR